MNVPGHRELEDADARALLVIRDITEILLGSQSMAFLLRGLLEGIQQHFHVHHACLLFPEGDTLRMVAGIGAMQSNVGACVPLGVGLAGVAAKKRRIVRIGNMKMNRRYLRAMVSSAPDGHKTVDDLPGLADADSRVAVPLVVGHELMAVFVAESPEPAVFSAESAELFELITSQIAGAIRNARAMEFLEAARTEEALARAQTEKALEELRTTQAVLIQNEKLASLGQLAAGVAHEVNTPLGAILASVQPLKEVATISRSLAERQNELDEESWEALLAALVVPGNDFSIGGPEAQAAVEEFENYFEGIGLEAGDEYADMLAETGLSIDMPAVKTLLESDIEPRDLEVLYRVRSLVDAAETIGRAAHSARKVVQALKSYVHRPSDSDERTPVSLRESLDTVLTMYHNKLKYGVDVQIEESNSEPVQAHPDQLIQIWTNLIHNAIDAMGGQGAIRVRIGGDERMAEVVVANRGPAIPDEVAARIFEPFYTTKPVGQGTGLGLHLCKQIAVAHGGDIEVQSDPEWTSFTVRLARRPVEA